MSQEKGQGKTKNSVVMNLNVNADDINTFKFEIQWASFVKFSRCQIFERIEKYYFQT